MLIFRGLSPFLRTICGRFLYQLTLTSLEILPACLVILHASSWTDGRTDKLLLTGDLKGGEDSERWCFVIMMLCIYAHSENVTKSEFGRRILFLSAVLCISHLLIINYVKNAWPSDVCKDHLLCEVSDTGRSNQPLLHYCLCKLWYNNMVAARIFVYFRFDGGNSGYIWGRDVKWDANVNNCNIYTYLSVVAVKSAVTCIPNARGILFKKKYTLTRL